MENVNEALKLIACAIEVLKDTDNLDGDRYTAAIGQLEEAVDKLAE
jgi:uncharacterized protein Yka (UPF0111/DUF47 family)